MISRDLKGYGKDYPVIAWPGDALLAVSLVVEFEEGAERSPLYGDDGHIHDNFMVHQKTYVEAQTGTVRAARGDSKPGDYIEFYAEIDLLVALSACPLGDALRDVVTGRGEAHPMGVEVYETGIRAQGVPHVDGLEARLEGKVDTAAELVPDHVGSRALTGSAVTGPLT